MSVMKKFLKINGEEESTVEFLEDFQRQFFVKSSFNWKFLSMYNQLQTSDVTVAELLIALCDNIVKTLRNIKHSKIEGIVRLLDLLSAVRDPCVMRMPPAEETAAVSIRDMEESLSASLSKRLSADNFNDCKELNFEQVSKAIYYGDVELMKILVRYGICQYSPEDFVEGEKPRQRKVRRSENPVFDREHLVTESEAMIFDGKCRHTCRCCVMYKLKDYSRRSLLVAGAINGSFRQKARFAGSHSNGTDHFKCFELYFQAVPDPYVTIGEIKRMLDGGSRKEDSEFWETFSKDFETNHPKYAGPRQPRSLLHLCRCHIRSELGKLGNLPYFVAKLEIPRTLRDRILADSEDFIL